MRSKKFSVVRALASVAVVLALCAVTTACESDWNGCGCAPKPSPCAPCQPCAPVAQASCGGCGPFPAEAKPGEAWCCVWVPPTYSTVKRQVCTCPEQCNKIWVPPTYKTVSKRVCVREACTVKIPIPAEYKTVEECVETCPARTEWQRIECRPCDQQAECWALVTIPAQYERRCKQVCTREESCREETTPAEYADQCEQVEDTCGFFKEEKIPAVFQDVEDQVCNNDGRWEWRRDTTCTVPMPQPCNPCTPSAPMPEPAPAPVQPK
jgi:hypothetical protein